MFTKVYKEEDIRLRGCSYNVASVYFHLKNKRDYFKNKNKNNGTCYDLTKYISEYTGICEKTVKRAIKTLKEIGLISTVIKGKVNHYSFPVLDAIENGTEIPDKQNIENNINNINDMGNFSGLTVNNNIIEQVEETNYTPIGDYHDNDISMYPSVEDFYSPIINDENTNTIPMKEIKQPVKIVASKQNSPVERLQDVINTDDNFYNVYNNCIDRVVDYKLHTGDIIKANKKEMAFAKLQSLYESYSIPWNKETKQFFMNDVDYSLNNTNKEIA